MQKTCDLRREITPSVLSESDIENDCSVENGDANTVIENIESEATEINDSSSDNKAIDTIDDLFKNTAANKFEALLDTAAFEFNHASKEKESSTMSDKLQLTRE